MYAIIKVQTNAVGYWSEKAGFVDSIDRADKFDSREEAERKADEIRTAEKWRFLIANASVFVIVA